MYGVICILFNRDSVLGRKSGKDTTDESRIELEKNLRAIILFYQQKILTVQIERREKLTLNTLLQSLQELWEPKLLESLQCLILSANKDLAYLRKHLKLLPADTNSVSIGTIILVHTEKILILVCHVWLRCSIVNYLLAFSSPANSLWHLDLPSVLVWFPRSRLNSCLASSSPTSSLVASLFTCQHSSDLVAIVSNPFWFLCSSFNSRIPSLLYFEFSLASSSPAKSRHLDLVSSLVRFRCSHTNSFLVPHVWLRWPIVNSLLAS